MKQSHERALDLLSVAATAAFEAADHPTTIRICVDIEGGRGRGHSGTIACDMMEKVLNLQKQSELAKCRVSGGIEDLADRLRRFPSDDLCVALDIKIVG